MVLKLSLFYLFVILKVSNLVDLGLCSINLFKSSLADTGLFKNELAYRLGNESSYEFTRMPNDLFGLEGYEF
jgi:hypothetical protein